MREKRIRPYQIVYPLIFVGLIIFFIYQCNDYVGSRREKLRGVWLVPMADKAYLLSFSSEYVGKGYTEEYYLRLIDPESGKIRYSNSVSSRSGTSTDARFMTASSLWLQKGDEWICLDFPTLKKRWSQKSFFNYLNKTHPEMGDPFSMKLAGNNFMIINKAGKTFFLAVDEVEKERSTLFYVFDEKYQVGTLASYKTPETRFKKAPVATIEITDGSAPKQKYHWREMNIYEKLQADTGYAKYYAVFTPDSNCYFFDGNHSRIIQKLVNDSAELKWKPIFAGKEWLKGDFLRPYKKYNDPPSNRCMVTSKNIAFVHYHTSLDKKENHLKLSGMDLQNQEILWDVDLTPMKIVDGCKPEQNFILNNILITVWIDGGYNGTLTGIDVNTGKLKWKVRK
jgi:hypothetical protein